MTPPLPLQRIDPSTVPDLYRRVGMRPKKRIYRNEDNCGCIIGALAADRGVDLMVISGNGFEDTAQSLGGLTGSYVYGLTLGFDGASDARCRLLDHQNESDHLAGHADGKAAWEALVEAGMVGGDA